MGHYCNASFLIPSHCLNHCLSISVTVTVAVTVAVAIAVAVSLSLSRKKQKALCSGYGLAYQAMCQICQPLQPSYEVGDAHSPFGHDYANINLPEWHQTYQNSETPNQPLPPHHPPADTEAQPQPQPQPQTQPEPIIDLQDNAKMSFSNRKFSVSKGPSERYLSLTMYPSI